MVKLRLSFLLLTKIALLISGEFSYTSAYLRFTQQSCTDLTPRNYDESTQTESRISPTSKSRFSSRRKERSDNYRNEIPFEIIATGKRYRRDADVVVQIEGGAFDGLMIQARTLPGNSESRGSNTKKNGVGVVGNFRHLKFPFKYLTCFDSPGSTVIDEGLPIKLGNASFVWRAPDHDAGDVRFIASVLRGVQYWVIVSNTLTFNPFPISSFSCGSTLACFRVCPYDQSTCSPKEAHLVFTYAIDVQKREIEFTLGGRLQRNNSYIAVAFGEDYENLNQGDMMACYMDRGRAKVEHLLIENLLQPPYLHSEPIEVDDYDLHLDEDGENKLWCRFRRSINSLSSAHLDASKPLYHFHFWGNLDYYFQRFILPHHRDEIYASAFKRNFSESVNEIVSGGSKIHYSGVWILSAILMYKSHGIFLVD